MSNSVSYRKNTRKQYEAVKKMDRQHFERFCKSLYDQGRDEALKDSIGMKEIKEVLLQVKGIGQKKADMIIEALEGVGKDE